MSHSPTTDLTRRELLKVTGVIGGAFLLAGCQLADRFRGIPQTKLPQIEGAWELTGDRLEIDLAKLPELDSLGGAVRIEGSALPEPILVVMGNDGEYHAYANRCSHGGRMIDPAEASNTLECCSVSRSTFDIQGNVLSGPAEGPLTTYSVATEGSYLVIELYGAAPSSKRGCRRQVAALGASDL